MLGWVIAFSIRHRIVVLLATCALVALGVHAFQKLPIDAVPDLTNVQVQVLTSAPSLGPLDIERLVTTPVERSMGGLPRLVELRSISRYGVSAVTVVFEDGVDPYHARQLVGERLVRARDSIPSEYGVPELGPMSTGLGEIYQFEVRGESVSPMDLRSILDWDIAPRLRLVPGVIDVNTFGGQLKTYEVSVEPAKLTAHGVALEDLFVALQTQNRITGGGAILRGREGLLVRGDALVQSLEDIRNILVATKDGTPIHVGELADVRFAAMLRQGAASRDGRGEIVAGMAMMLTGENSRDVAVRVQQAVDAINATLPNGVRIEPFYDRTSLVNQTIHTVAKNLAEGGMLVIVVLFLLLRNIRSGLIAAAMIPLAMCFAFLGMREAGVSGNLLSLGAVDFGLVVDGAIILLENAVHHLAEERAKLGRPLDHAERDAVIERSALEVRSATAFGELIIALVYLPVLTLQGVEGKMFRPMALTVLFALLGAFILSLTFVPALASLLLSRTTVDKPSPIISAVQQVYEPLLRMSLGHPGKAALLAVIAFAGSGLVASQMGSEFVPRLDEGAIIIETNRLPSTSLEESLRQAAVIEKTLGAFPEVKTVVVKTGRPEIANDPMGVEQSDGYVILKPRDEWPPPRDHEALVARMSKALDSAVPGAAFGFSQPIEMRMNELVSGVRSDLAVKVYGDDLQTLARLGDHLQRIIGGVRGAKDLKVDRVEGEPVLKVSVDRLALAQRDVSAAEVLDAVEVVGGKTVGEVLEGRRRFALRVRLPEGVRNDREAIERLPLRTRSGAFVTVGGVAHAEIVDEPLVVNHESVQRRLIVQANVRGRDLGGFADEVQDAVARKLKLPPGYHLAWGGQFENLRRARARLFVVVPLALAVIAALLYLTFHDVRAAVLILLNVPMAATGGVLLLAARGLPLSISAGVGFVALFGVAVLNGLVLVSTARDFQAAGHSAEEAARLGALRRLRPVLTTALVASLGFVPMALATGAGAEVQRPLATVVIGGLVTSTLLTLLVVPTLYARVFGKRSA
ncbi:Cobalt-zinc-cadmium resistance protein CzcA [Labilithrix luteola]|uniref:Cobalt-zinc-cadmium resistance protein CzcA n=1 Tax=Labilithrix luteola TaxID=1391654 RepID=A0A0K1PT14_9BACT|nr:CusA/CzcA family heavy metal efflux RND transporter [Labilithrix luteola]AKU96254.1 Cobalt-zinc-cadmium resistance protein CzcA [Labilithrix luteola]